jgi:signal transduction histidine kinase
LTWAICGVLAISLFGFSLLLHAAFGRALLRQFDGRLIEDARAIATMVEERASGPWEFEPGAVEDLERMFGPALFEVRMDDGAVLARSSALGERDRYAQARLPALVATTLPDGQPARLYRAALAPRADDEGPPHPSGRRVLITVVRGTKDIDAAMRVVQLLLWGSALTALALASFAGALAIRSGLQPIARLSARADAIDAQRLGERLPVHELPRELQPAVTKLNELLIRVEESFVRERQWNRAVSHELRTPLAGLRSILDVCLTRERDAAAYRVALGEARDVVVQISALVEQLLLLARLDAHSWSIALDSIDLRQLVDECFEPYAEQARARQLRFDNRVPAGTSLTSDREKLRMVVGNLLSNAVEYTAQAGSVSVTHPAADGGLIDVSDSGPAIPPDALQRIFDPFVRLDPARSGGAGHCGIGLTLVRSLCVALNLAVVAENRADGWVVFRLSRHGAA